MSRLLSCSCLSAALFFCAGICYPVRAAVIYSQTIPTPPLSDFSSNDTATDQKIADNFVLNTAGSATVRSLQFIGGYIVRNPPPSTPPLDALPADNFRVVFFADSAGVPGLPIPGGDFHVVAPVQRTATGGPLLNGVDTPLHYILDLDSGVILNPATVYWVSIMNNAGPNYGWAWARAAGVLDQQVAATYGDISTGPWSAATNGGMYFEISDNNVPEPASLLILLSAAFGMLCPFVAHRTRQCCQIQINASQNAK